MKICLICSAGGHLMQLHLLEDFWQKHERFWVTENKVDARSLLSEEEVFFGYFPTTRNIWNLLRNSFLAVKLIFSKSPDLIVSNGAGIAVPFFYLAKLLGIKTVYIEVYDRVNSRTLTGRLVHPVADKFIVQWESQQKLYKNSILLGPLI